MQYPIINLISDAYINNGWTGLKSASILPGGYTELDYIESSGTQYIDTGIFPNGNTKVEMSAYIMERRSGNNQIYNARGNNKYFGFSDYNNRMNLYYGSTWTNMNKVTDIPYTLYVNQAGDMWSININENQYNRNGRSISFISDYSMYIFGANSVGNIYEPIQKMRLYYFRIWEDGATLSRNFIPCKRNSDNAVGLYDTVTNTFFNNSGTGSFIQGNEIVSGIDVIDFVLRLKLPLPHYFPHSVIDALISAADGQYTEEEKEILRHYLTPLGIGGI